SAVENMPVLFARGLRRDGIIKAVLSDISSAGAGVAGILMNREKCRTRLVHENRLGAVAVVDIKIINSNTFDAGGQRFEGRDGDAVQVTESHGFATCRMMPGRPHQAKHAFTPARAMHRLDSRAGGSAGAISDIRKPGGIGVEILSNT